MSFLNELKKWIDGEDAISQTPAEAKQQLSEWDEFFVKIALEVEGVMKREMFTPPGGATYLPGEYIIYLSKEDDQLWQGRKRRGLEEGLRNSLVERASQLVGDKTLQSDRVAFSFGIDGALTKGQVRVQPIWDEDSPKTQVTPRKRQPEPAVENHVTEPLSELEEKQGEESDKTIVRPRAPRFKIDYAQNDETTRQFQAHKNRIEVGRGSKDFSVDLKLEGDPEISRKHAVITLLESGKFKVECVGRNSIEAGGRELQPGEQIEVERGQPIKVGVYTLTMAGLRRS